MVCVLPLAANILAPLAYGHPQSSHRISPRELLLSRTHRDHRAHFDNTAKMSQPSKIAANSPSRASPSEIETSVNNALEDLQNNISDMRSSLRPLQFVSAREVR